MSKEENNTSTRQKRSKLLELQRKKEIELQKQLDTQLREVQEYFEFISDEDETENIEREEYWVEKESKGEGLIDFEVDSKGREIAFMNNSDIKPRNCVLPLTQDHVDEFTYCAYHPTYTIRNYFKIISSDHGVVPFRLYDFQEQQVRDFFKYPRSLVLSARQAGKTSVSAAVLLFYCMFNKSKNVAIIANKKATAIEILDRFKLMYLNLPMWLKPGVVKWNVGQIEFSNGCKIITSATTAASIRGQSIACVDGDTKITIINSHTLKIEKLTIKTLGKRLLAKLNDDVIRRNDFDQLIINNNTYEVLTPSGWSKFDGVVITEDKETISLTETNLICTPDHKIKIDNEFIEAINLPHTYHKNSQKVYDLLNVEKGNEYITNDVISHNCLYIDEISFIPKKMWDSFYKSTFPVISASKLAKIICTTTPNGKDHFYYMWQDALNKRSTFHAGRVVKWTDIPGRDEKWKANALAELGNNEEAFKQEYECEFLTASVEYVRLQKLEELERTMINPEYIDINTSLHIFEQPKAKRDYVISVDVSSGKGQDHQAFAVIDISEMPLKVVATLKNNKIDTIEYAGIIYHTAMKYNDAFLIIENNFNDISKDLWFNYEYTNILNFNLSKSEHKQGKYHEIGLRTTPKVRRIGEEYFKHLVENDKIILNDIRIVKELNNLDYSEFRKRFIPRDESINDDLWDAFKCFAYVARMMYFENLISKGGLNLYSIANPDDNVSGLDPLSFLIKPVTIATSMTHDFDRSNESKKRRKNIGWNERGRLKWM